MLMNELIKSDTRVPTTGIDIVVRAGATLPVFAALATHTDGLAPTRWRPRLD